MKSYFLWLTMAVLLVPVSSIHAKGLFSEVTPTDRKAAGFVFTITSKRLTDGRVTFRIVTTEASEKFSRNASMALSALEVKRDAKGETRSIRPERSLSFERDGRSRVCSFAIDAADLRDGNLCFVLTNYPSDGMPSADLVFARLKDFAAH
jgi:hypothetical protein